MSLRFSELREKILDNGHTCEELCALLDISPADLIDRFRDHLVERRHMFDVPEFEDGVYTSDEATDYGVDLDEILAELE